MTLERESGNATLVIICQRHSSSGKSHPVLKLGLTNMPAPPICLNLSTTSRALALSGSFVLATMYRAYLLLASRYCCREYETVWIIPFRGTRLDRKSVV